VTARSTRYRGKSLIIIHNFRELETEAEVERYITSDIVEAMKAQKVDLALNIRNKLTYYQTQNTETSYLQTQHVVFAKSGSQAGNKWNKNSLSFLKAKIPPSGTAVMDIVKTLADGVQTLLPEYFYSHEPKTRSEALLIGAQTRRVDYYHNTFDKIAKDLVTLNSRGFPDFDLEIKTTADPNIDRICLKKGSTLKYINVTFQEGRPESAFNPAADIVQTPQKWILSLEVPGIDKLDDIKVDFADGETLKISGVRKLPFSYNQGEPFYSYELERLEQRFGHFQKHFSVPRYVTGLTDFKEMANRKLEDGVFTIQATIKR